jgi:riboflavin synthase
MFTGIVTTGRIVSAAPQPGLLRLTVESDFAKPEIGASIAHDGVCLTVVEADAGRHVVEVAPESLKLTTLNTLKPGDRVNLERSLRVGDELGGHIMQGHVDGLGDVVWVHQDGEGYRVKIKPPRAIEHLIAPKGAIAVQGVSLTVTEVDEDGFGVLIIPHTWAVTTLSKLQQGDKVNLEADTMARYAARLAEARSKI